jgi:hypothetical protein
MVALALLCTANRSQAQTTAVLQGRVVDASGAGIPVATIGVRDNAGDVSETVVTDSEGHYRLHPAKLRVMGLVPAIRGLCREFPQTVTVTFSHHDVPEASPKI